MKKWLVSLSVTIGLLASVWAIAKAQSTTSLTINNILVTPRPENVAYEVKAYLSVLDSAGIPVKGLVTDNISVVEDAKPMVVDSLTTANDPISLVLVLDTSGSMAGTPIKSAKDAANSFLLGMSTDDEVSIISFNSTIKPVIDFTKDRQAAGQQLETIDAVPNSGTCLYNAAYQAVQNAAALPPGRRAVVLLTDGVDETGNGKPCSTYTIDDVIQMATQGNVPIPVFTLGLGTRVDQQSLQRLAALTGGRFQYAPSSNQLGVIFHNLSDQLKSQYVITYTTTSAQGSHTLIINASTPAGSAKDTRNFISPAMPAGILIKSPTVGQAISGKQLISAVVTGQTQGIEKVVFYVGGKEVGESTTSPFEINFEFTSTFAGNTTIGVVALGANGEEIARQNINVTVIVPTIVSGAAPTPSEAPISPSPQSTIIAPGSAKSSIPFLLSPSYLIAGGIILLLIVVVIMIIVLRKRRGKNANLMSGFGTLEVLSSDDKGFIKKKFEINRPITRLGRLVAENEISFPVDSPVSRQHAIIEKKGDNFFLREVDQGTKYGTYIGDQKVGTVPVLLHHGDEIRLGNRLNLRFTLQLSEQTIDQEIPKEDITIDHLLPPKESYDPFATQDSEK